MIKNKIMDYKLCKQLKDAGFPQPSTGKFYVKHRQWEDTKQGMKEVKPIFKVEDWGRITDYENYYIPTLPELIKECGKDFTGLYYQYWEKEDIQWLADGHGPNTGAGAFPEQAVSNLYIKLKKQKHGISKK